MKQIRTQLILASMLLLISCVEMPQELVYKGFTSKVESEEIITDLGETVLLKSDVICENGLKEVEAKFYGWSEGGSPATEKIIVTGSPKTYEFTYTLDVPTYVSVSQTRIEFYMRNYRGEEIVQTFVLKINADTEEPSLTVVSPIANQVLSPNAPLVVQATSRDNIALKHMKIESSALEISKTIYPQDEKHTISATEQFNVQARNGEYELVVSAEDMSGNVASETVKIKILEGTKPEIIRTDSNKDYVAAGAAFEFSFRASTNSECVIESVMVVSSDLGANLSFEPDLDEFEQTCRIDVPRNIGTRSNIPVKISAKNNYGEVTTFTIYVSVLEKLYVVGSAVMCYGKEGKAMAMTQDENNRNVFYIDTWVDAQQSWFKILSEPAWNGILNLGLNETGDKVINDGESGYMRAADSGYHRIFFDLSSWEYSVAALSDVPAVGEYENIYLYGENFSYKSNGTWTAPTAWETMVSLKRHPDTPHRFYLDVICYKSVLGFAAQDNKDEGGVFFGIEGDAGWKWVWWEHISELVVKNKEEETAKMKEDSRDNTVMRVIIDTYLNKISWLEAAEYTYPQPEQK